jgi:hypothetical protein
MKKMLKWYNSIKANNVEIKLREEDEDDAGDVSVETEQETKVEEAQEGHS